MESTLPLMKQTPEQMLEESRQYAYAKISGENDPSKMPDSIADALRQRAGSVATDISDMVSSSKFGGMAENILGKAEETDSVSTPNVEDENLMAKTSRLFSNFFNYIKKEAANVAKKEGKEKAGLRDLVNLPHYWLQESYDKLLKDDTPKSPPSRILRSCSMILLGSTLAVLGAASATVRKGEESARTSFDKLIAGIPDRDRLLEMAKNFAASGSRASVTWAGAAAKWVEGYMSDSVRSLLSRGMQYWEDRSSNLSTVADKLDQIQQRVDSTTKTE